MNTFGFIGTGNMGGALARAAAKSVAPENIYLADACKEKAAQLAQQLGCQCAAVEDVAKNCHFIFLGVKPQVVATMLGSIAPILKVREQSPVLISMAAGVRICDLQDMAGGAYPIIRIMPNIPVSVGEGVILYDATENVSENDLSSFRSALSAAGLVDPLPEALIDAGSALSGCGPAFVSLFIEALADGAVACGLTRQQATNYACQTLIGTEGCSVRSRRLHHRRCCRIGAGRSACRCHASGGCRLLADTGIGKINKYPHIFTVYFLFYKAAMLYYNRKVN